jgi:hypothetical protein
MSRAEQLPTPSFEPDFWLDLEVPGDIIADNWEEEFSSTLTEYANSQRIVGKELELYWRYFKDEEMPREKENILDEIISHNDQWGMNLYSAYEFSSGKRADYVSYYYDLIESNVASTQQSDLYTDFKENARKFGQVLFLQLYDSDSLRSILALDHCYGKKPRSLSRATSPIADPLDEIEMSDILDQLEEDSRHYRLWHKFTHEANNYIVIKRHFRDDVGRQVNDNRLIELATFVVAKFRGNELEIYSEKPQIAEKARQGINESLPDDSPHLYEPPDESVPQEDLEHARQQIQSMDGEQSTDSNQSVNNEQNFALIGVCVDNAPLSGSPKVEISSSEGILGALDDLREKDIMLLNNLSSVAYVRVRFSEKSFKLFPEPVKSDESDDEETRWQFRYHCSFPSEQERDNFEDAMEEETGMRPVFVHP